jgi:hypothetical protein
MKIQAGNIIKYNSMDIRTLETISPEFGLVLKVEPIISHYFLKFFANVLLSDGAVAEFCFQEDEVEVVQ